MISLDINAKQIDRLGNAIKAAGGKMDLVLIRAVNHTGPIARTAMIRALVPQTGLKRKTLDKALKATKALNGSNYTIVIKGGNVRLMFFKPRETRKGVVAMPWNKKTLYPGTFTKGGSFKGAVNPATGRRGNGRVPLNMGGAVLVRKGKERLPLGAAPRSGLYIPTEATSGNSEAVFHSTVRARLGPRVEHELYRIIGAL